MTTTRTPTQRDTLPLPALIVLSVIGFTTMLTETIPAGLLSDIGLALDTSDSLTGQLLTAYAVASMVAAIPLTTLTRSWPRKPLLVATVLGIVSANIITAISSELYLTAAARLVAGACAGIQWAMMAGYAMRMVDSTLKGRALAVAMAGIPIALAFGIPLGTLLGSAVGWRGVFIILAAAGTTTALLAATVLPSYHGDTSKTPSAFTTVIKRPGIILILLGGFGFQAAHMTMYTYIEPFLRLSGLDSNISAVLLALGVAAIAGLWATGTIMDRHLAPLTIAVLGLFCLATVLMGLLATSSPAVATAAIVWGFALGCAPTIYQTACARAAGPSVDIAQSILVTLFNAGMAAGSLLGGVALTTTNTAHSLPWISFAIFLALLVVTTLTRSTSLPSPPKPGKLHPPSPSTLAKTTSSRTKRQAEKSRPATRARVYPSDLRESTRPTSTRLVTSKSLVRQHIWCSCSRRDLVRESSERAAALVGGFEPGRLVGRHRSTKHGFDNCGNGYDVIEVQTGECHGSSVVDRTDTHSDARRRPLPRRGTRDRQGSSSESRSELQRQPGQTAEGQAARHQ